MANRRQVKVIVLILFAGAMIGTYIGELLGFVLPEGVVRQFFLQSVEFSLGGLFGGGDDALSLNLGVLTLILGLKIKLNFAGIFGLGMAYYFLRYFR
ncbi:MAG: DUF4321 domain-containing protein [Candidatus Marinimicrobia bacterium]|jgi:hypothetical protein|nr:hypothetical protein [Candidatus Neomarinimicrobiota bacterium]MDP6456099.1 DUF4321 domain-containing protein [Candidatus Neomarinimicrobiota bacterium]MDP6592883.1 DUF4321 domain-containing protein [Candidatus Neomarinimicrobiota bacterium]MDP6836156.1 DUF4321 domain-containing protein [Candidatus Neomarinimicrobiota bacterium]MDP6967163.1 DUF4321 domain-containing protein [Candidatus Neomarinimicrobiota bacterium]|tara:strand:- start:4725 stop:5015 length:291 start_codon:yes stop_codon:yes gene_type:complete